jgi:glycine cleavage system H protein
MRSVSPRTPSRFMQLPATLQYTKEHEWLRLDGDVATVGITDFAQKELGDIVYVDITTLDQDVRKDEVFGSVEAVKTVSDLFSPVSGTVIEVNEKLGGSPDLVNSDPYGDGWMVRIRLADPSEVTGLMDAAAYGALIGA